MDTTVVNALSFDKQQLLWALLLIIGFPVLMLALNEFIQFFKRREKPIASTLKYCRNLVLPLCATILLLQNILETPDDAVALRILKTLLWISLLHVALSFINDVVFAEAIPGSWQARVPKLLIDLSRAFLVLIGAATILSTVWDLDLGALVTALGVGSVVIGLALQEPLSNVFAGIMLLFEQPIKIGDWIEVEGVSGQVAEINWRAVHVLLPATSDMLLVPNSILYKGTFRNMSRPARHHTEFIEIGFSYDDPPNKVRRVILGVIRKIPDILTTPEPKVLTQAFADYAITYRILFTIAEKQEPALVRSEFMNRIWYACRRYGLTIPFPTTQEIALEPPPPTSSNTLTTAELLSRFPQLGITEFPSLDMAPLAIHVEEYSQGEPIVSEGDPLRGVHFLFRGSARLTVKDRAGNVQEIASLQQGDFFGEGALQARAISDVTVTAMEDSDIAVLEPEVVQKLIAKLPRLAREIGSVIDSRRRAIQTARQIVRAVD